MSPHQVLLARHALGLEYGVKRSYRNRYYANPSDAKVYAAWIGMVACGDADGVSVNQKHHMTHFWLTRKGAEKVLRKGESLDAEDFDDARSA